MLHIAFAVLMAMQNTAQAPSPEDIRNALTLAEGLYYGAQFNESIELLKRVDQALQLQPGMAREKASAKLQLALDQIGLNDPTKAKAFLAELYTMDSSYQLDSAQFPPKVLALAAEAKATAADSFYRTGMAAYKSGDLKDALSSFQSVKTLAPGNELASQYIDLINNKLQLAQDRFVLESQLQAARSQAAEARPAPKNDAIKVVAEMAPPVAPPPQPKPQPVVDRLPAVPSGSPSAPPAADRPAVAPVGCLDMSAPLALARLKTRVDPLITNEIRRYLTNGNKLEVRVKVTISEAGIITALQASGSNPLINDTVLDAVRQWKFTPVRDPSGPRCVETEIPVVLRAQ
jgi:tetratricopeptide (TPR) repeat protein